ncbi:MAG: PDZ domain-containing protein [Planctomycetes bacterium]|nr:PDZ domain-containing protein [Planctomycetota bacterium]
MKRWNLVAILALSLAALVLSSAVNAEDKDAPVPPKQAPTPPPPPAPPAPPEAGYGVVNEIRRMLVSPAGGAGNVFFTKRMAAEKVKAAYLGVVTRAADATLRKQLKLPEGVGLVVSFLDKDGPAKAAGLELHDVLSKLDDQILINERQLVTLVRMHKPGDKLELTAIHEGKEQKFTAALVEKDVPPLDAFDETGLAPGEGEPMRMKLFNMPAPPPGALANPVWSKALAFSDPEVSVTVETKDGEAHIVAKDKDGKILFEGPAKAGVQIPPLVIKHLGEALKWTQGAAGKDVLLKIEEAAPEGAMRFEEKVDEGE